MEEGKIDGFWANGMGAEVAVKRGLGTMVLDARRGDGPRLRGYTFGVLATRADIVEKTPDKAAAAVRALVKTQKALKADPEARHQGRREVVSGVRGEPDRHAGRARPAVLRPGDLQGHVRQHVQVRADGRPDQGRRQVRGRGGDAVQQFGRPKRRYWHLTVEAYYGPRLRAETASPNA